MWRKAYVGTLIALLLPVILPAATVTLQFNSQVSSVIDPFGNIGSLVHPGDLVVGTLSYDPALVSLAPPAEVIWRCGLAPSPCYDVPGTITLEINSLMFTLPGTHVSVSYNGIWQGFGVRADNDTGIPSQWYLPAPRYYGIYSYFGMPAMASSTDSMPNFSIDASQVARASGSVYSTMADPEYHTNPTSYEIQFGIPEPGTVVLVGGGMLLTALGLIARRRATRRPV